MEAGAISGCGGGPLPSIVSGTVQLQRPERQDRSSGCRGRSSCRCQNPTSGTIWGPGNRRCGRAARGRGRATSPSARPSGMGVDSSGGRARRHDVLMCFGASFALPAPRPETHTWASRTGPIAPGLNQLHDAAVVLGGVDLDAHLRGDAWPSRPPSESAALPTRRASAASRSRRASCA